MRHRIVTPQQQQQYRNSKLLDTWMPTEDPGLKRLRLANEEGMSGRQRPVVASRTFTKPATKMIRTKVKPLPTQMNHNSGGTKRKSMSHAPRGMVWDVDEEVWTCEEVVVGDKDPSASDEQHDGEYGAPSLAVTMENMEVAVLDFVENGLCNATGHSKAILFRYGEFHLDAAEQGNILHILAHYYQHYALECNMKETFEDYKANGNNAKEQSKTSIRKYGTFHMAPGSQPMSIDQIVDRHDRHNVEDQATGNLYKGTHDGTLDLYTTPPSKGQRGENKLRFNI